MFLQHLFTARRNHNELDLVGGQDVQIFGRLLKPVPFFFWREAFFSFFAFFSQGGMTDNFLAEGSLSPLASIRPRRVSNEDIITLSNSAVVSTEDAPGYGSEAVRGGFVSLDGTRFVTVGSALYIITTQGFVSILAGHPDVAGFEDGQGIDARFDLPYALTMDKEGILQVADYNNNAIRRSSIIVIS